MADYIRYAKEHGIPVGPGRGSAAGSLVAYSLGITDIDPIRWNLIFERFLNPERRSMPDIDVDFCQDRRDEVIDYVRNRYGPDFVCQITTFGNMKARAVVRDVGGCSASPTGRWTASPGSFPPIPRSRSTRRCRPNRGSASSWTRIPGCTGSWRSRVCLKA